MTVPDLLPFIRILSNFRKWVGKSRQDKPLKAAQPGFLSVPPCTGDRGFRVSKCAVECCKRQLIFLSFENTTCKCFVVQMKL